ncbi:XRE family transcriptional regulator [Bradyrhizobium liaoningense]|uniref:XRE family transcriptional regulator n=1 Tax=Bradyrhizobium liaoningense TaxID=43992 RepID=UPI001BA9F8AA|nr:XRE family transcriptional regulator [Bradyrhizobium liaoningense]MBR0818896.1 ImmA/IrrE family metallo-endopeptidase [Bradyrhizobium liaoningense]
MTSVLETMPPTEVGERLREARDRVKLKQADAAESVGLSRTTLVAIEQGQRRVRIDELRKLANLYRMSINELMRQEAIHADLTPKFRKLFQQEDGAIELAVKQLEDLARAEAELEQLLGVQRLRNYPSERPILPGDVRAQAELDAFELRQRLGLGLSPISDIVTLLELELGVRVYIRRIDGGISGVFAYDEALGACILLNGNHPRDRRAQTAAHELGHLVSTRREPEVLEEGITENSREERYANTFGRAFMTPARAVMQKFKEVTVGSEKLTRRHVIILAHFFGVSREAIVRRLEELKLAKSGTWDWFQANGGISDQQASQVLGDLTSPDVHKTDADRPTTLRLGLLAGEAWRRGLLSEGQLARMLHLDRVELRRMFDGLEIEGSEADGALMPD